MTGVGVGRGLIVVCDFEAVDRARFAQLLTWAELAREASLSPTTVARLRRTPRVRLGTLDRVAERLRAAHAEKVQPRGIAGIATPRSMA